MVKLLSFIAALFVAGCSVDNSASQHDYTEVQYDASTNVTLLPSTELYISFEDIVNIHKSMQQCLGLSVDTSTDNTIIAFRSFEESDDWFQRDTGGVVPSLGAGWGFHIVLNGNSYVFVNTDLDKEPYVYQGFDRDEYTDTQTVKHEFIHSINHHVLGHGHGHGDEFSRCDAWVNTYN